MSDIAAIEARHKDCAPDQCFSPTMLCDASATLARLHEVEAQRDNANEELAEADAEVRRNAITPQQRAVLEAAVAYVQRPGEPNRRAIFAAVDALLEAAA